MHDRSPPQHGLDRGAAVTMVLLCVTWGMGQVAVKIANVGISPGVQAGLRSAGAALLGVLWSRARGSGLFARDGTLGAGIAAGLMFGLEFLLIFWGLVYTQAVRAALLIYLAPFV